MVNEIVVDLKAGENLILTRTVKGFDVRVGSSSTPEANPVVASIEPKDTLVVTGGDEKAALSVPFTVGINENDFVPRIRIDTAMPLWVEGGAFILEKKSRQAAQIAVTPKEFFGINTKKKPPALHKELNVEEDMKSVLSAGRPSDGVATQQFNYNNPLGQVSTLSVQEGGGEIRFINAEKPDDILFTLSGKQTIGENRNTYKKAAATTLKSWIETHVERQQAVTPKSQEDGIDKNKSWEAARKIEATLKQMQPTISGLMAQHPGLKEVYEKAQENAKKILSQEPSSEAMKALKASVDRLYEVIPGDPAGNMLKPKIKQLKEELDGMKLSMAEPPPSLPEDVRKAAFAAVSPSLPRQEALEVGHAATYAPQKPGSRQLT